MKIRLNTEIEGEPTVGEIREVIDSIPDDATFKIVEYVGKYDVIVGFEQHYPMSEFINRAFKQ